MSAAHCASGWGSCLRGFALCCHRHQSHRHRLHHWVLEHHPLRQAHRVFLSCCVLSFFPFCICLPSSLMLRCSCRKGLGLNMHMPEVGHCYSQRCSPLTWHVLTFMPRKHRQAKTHCHFAELTVGTCRLNCATGSALSWAVEVTLVKIKNSRRMLYVCDGAFQFVHYLH